MPDKIKIGILMGGSSSEREISYMSAENIVKSLNKDKYQILAYDIPFGSEGSWINDIAEDKPDIVLNALHGGKGEDGGVQGVLRCLGLPFVGSGVMTSAVCMDKNVCKTVMASGHIPVIEGIPVKRNGYDLSTEEAAARIGFPLIVKPNKGGSSLGISMVHGVQELRAAVSTVFDRFCDDALIEKYIDGRELTCAVLQGKNGPEVISLLDINKTGSIFDYNAKYTEKKWAGGISSLPAYMQDMITGIAKKAFTLLGCRGYACVDMILMEEQIYVIEVNTLPGMTAQSLIPNAVKALGMDLGSFFDRLIEQEIGDKNG